MKQSLLFLTLFFYSTFASALNPPIKTPEDIIGCWERINFSKDAQDKINEIEPWPGRYQWFCFDADGNFSSMASTRPQNVTSKSLQEAFAILPKETKYTIIQRGIVKTVQIFQNSTSKQIIHWGANFLGRSVFFDNKTIKKGTLIMSIYDPEKQKNVYHRYMIKIS